MQTKEKQKKIQCKMQYRVLAQLSKLEWVSPVCGLDVLLMVAYGLGLIVGGAMGKHLVIKEWTGFAARGNESEEQLECMNEKLLAIQSGADRWRK